jgi:hypothetical protein
MKILSNQKGFSLLQGMLFASVLAGAGLVTTRLLTDQKLSQKSAETKDQVEELHQLVYSILQNKDNCRTTFLNNSPSISPSVSTSQTLGAIRTASGTQAFLKWDGVDTERKYVNNTVIISDMSVTFSAPQDPGILRITYERFNTSDELKRSKSGFGGKLISKDIQILAQRSGASFESCYAVQAVNENLMKEFCENFTPVSGGASILEWDDNENRCKLKANVKCAAGLVFTGIKSDGTANCQQLKDIISMSDLLDTGSAEVCNNAINARFEIVGNKVKVDCTPSPCTTYWQQDCRENDPSWTGPKCSECGGPGCIYNGGAPHTTYTCQVLGDWTFGYTSGNFPGLIKGRCGVGIFNITNTNQLCIPTTAIPTAWPPSAPIPGVWPPSYPLRPNWPATSPLPTPWPPL